MPQDGKGAVHAPVSCWSQRANTSSPSPTLIAPNNSVHSACAEASSAAPSQTIRLTRLPAGQELLLSRAEPENTAMPGTSGDTWRNRLVDWFGSFGLSSTPWMTVFQVSAETSAPSGARCLSRSFFTNLSWSLPAWGTPPSFRAEKPTVRYNEETSTSELAYSGAGLIAKADFS